MNRTLNVLPYKSLFKVLSCILFFYLYVMFFLTIFFLYHSDKSLKIYNYMDLPKMARLPKFKILLPTSLSSNKR